MVNQISIIIPTLNEESYIHQCLTSINDAFQSTYEIIIVDGGSTDQTLDICSQFDLKIIHSEVSRRSTQLNLGAKEAQYSILYFLHADARVFQGIDQIITQTLQEGHAGGLFAYDLYPDHYPHKINALATRKKSIFTGGGDQSLFIKKSVFNLLGGYKSSLILMEDFDLYWRLKKKHSIRLIDKPIQVSARKYLSNNYIKINLVQAFIFFAFLVGIKQSTLVKIYQYFIK